MEYQKIKNLLDTTSDTVPRFTTNKWIEVHDQSGGPYNINKQIRFKTPMFQSNLCDYCYAYVVVKGTITITDPNNVAYYKKLAFKNNAPFIYCISKINNTLTDNSEDLHIVMPMYNLTEYNKNYSNTTGKFWNYYRDKPDSGAVGNTNYCMRDSKSFDYKKGITEKLENGNTEKEDIGIVVPLKHLSNFWRTLDIPLINSKINLILTWTENCAIKSKATRDADHDADPAVVAVNTLTNETFKITDTKWYVPVAIRSRI